MNRPLLFSVALSSLFLACGVGAGPASAPNVSATARASLNEPSDPGSCIATLKEQVYAGTLTLEAYEAQALSDCGIDFAAVDTTKGTPSEPEPVQEPTPEEQAYAACANAVKAEVAAGTLAIEAYESAVAARCSP